MKVLARTNTVVQFNLKMHLLFFWDECPGGDLKEKSMFRWLQGAH